MKRACNVAAILFFLAAPVSAQVFESYSSSSGKHWEITPTVGGYFGSDIYSATGVNLHASDSWSYGGRIAFYPQRQFGLEVGYMYAQSDISSSKLIGGTQKYGTLALHQIDFNGNFEGGSSKLVGYFTIGLGMTIVDPKINSQFVANPSSSTKFAFNTGLGFKAWMNDKLGLRVDGRLRTIDTNRTTSSGVWCDYYGYCWYYASTWYNSGEVTGGIVLRF